METNGGDEQQIIAATESVEKTLESLDPSQQQAILLKLLGNSAAAGFTDGAFASLQALVTNEQTRRQQSSYAETVETSHAAEIAQIDATIVQRGIYGKFNAGVSMHGQQLVTANSIDFTAYPESFDIRRDQNQPIRDITNLQNALKESAHQPEIRAMLKNHFFIRMPYDAENEIVDIFFWSDHVDTVGGRNRPTGYIDTLFVMPKDNAARLETIIRENADNAEMFFQTAASGLERKTPDSTGVGRVKSDVIVILDPVKLFTEDVKGTDRYNRQKRSVQAGPLIGVLPKKLPQASTVLKYSSPKGVVAA